LGHNPHFNIVGQSSGLSATIVTDANALAGTICGQATVSVVLRNVKANYRYSTILGVIHRQSQILGFPALYTEFLFRLVRLAQLLFHFGRAVREGQPVG
jgi:hypothetical protein